MSLVESLLFLESISENESHIRILHGDTLTFDLLEDLDILSVADEYIGYEWDQEKEGTIWSTSFSSKKFIDRKPSSCNKNFSTVNLF